MADYNLVWDTYKKQKVKNPINQKKGLWDFFAVNRYQILDVFRQHTYNGFIWKIEYLIDSFLRGGGAISESEYLYQYYRQKYYNSCNEISNCEKQIYKLENQRRQVVDRINRFNGAISKSQETLEKLNAVIGKESSLDSKLSAVVNKTEQAAANFSEMVQASDIASKNITDVFSSEIAKTKSMLSSVWDTLKSRKNSLNEKLSGQQADPKQ